jgi:hypothetical protein
MANRRFIQFYNTLHAKPVQLDCNFIVNPLDPAGVMELKGPGIEAVYMASLAPSASNPNPAAGYILVKLQDNYNKYYFGGAQFNVPSEGAAINIDAAGAALTPGQVYLIDSVGTSTEADWQAVGLPIGMVPAQYTPFVALATGAGVGTGTVKVPFAAGAAISHIETIGNVDATIKSSAPVIAGVQSGSYILLQCLGATAVGDTTLVATAPAPGTKVQLSFVLSNSKITVQGE